MTETLTTSKATERVDAETGEVNEDGEVTVDLSGELADSESFSYKFHDGDLWYPHVDADAKPSEARLSDALSGTELANHLAVMDALSNGETEASRDSRWSAADTGDSEAFSVMRYELNADGSVEISSDLVHYEVEFGAPIPELPVAAAEPAPVLDTPKPEVKPALFSLDETKKPAAPDPSPQSYWTDNFTTPPELARPEPSLIDFLAGAPRPPEPATEPTALNTIFEPPIIPLLSEPKPSSRGAVAEAPLTLQPPAKLEAPMPGPLPAIESPIATMVVETTPTAQSEPEPGGGVTAADQFETGAMPLDPTDMTEPSAMDTAAIPIEPVALTAPAELAATELQVQTESDSEVISETSPEVAAATLAEITPALAIEQDIETAAVSADILTSETQIVTEAVEATVITPAAEVSPLESDLVGPTMGPVTSIRPPEVSANGNADSLTPVDTIAPLPSLTETAATTPVVATAEPFVVNDLDIEPLLQEDNLHDTAAFQPALVIPTSKDELAQDYFATPPQTARKPAPPSQAQPELQAFEASNSPQWVANPYEIAPTTQAYLASTADDTSDIDISFDSDETESPRPTRRSYATRSTHV